MSKKFGWVEPDKRTLAVARSHERFLENTPIFSTVSGGVMRGSGEGKVVLLHKFLEQITGKAFPVNKQTIGDCVSHGWAKAIEVLMTVEILLKNQPDEWPGMLIATEWIYGTSRVIQGGGRLGNQDGSLGSWAAGCVKENGILFRKKYKQGSKEIDLSRYSGQRAKDYGYRDLPMQFEEIADEHPIEKTALITSWEDCRDSIANGYPVPVCSQVGFTSKRDSKGFAKRSGSWAHCMVFIAVDDEDGRPGALCVNSWGTDWISGPKRHGQPEGSFWVDAETVDRMMRAQDSYAVADHKGFVKRSVDYNLWTL